MSTYNMVYLYLEIGTTSPVRAQVAPHTVAFLPLGFWIRDLYLLDLMKSNFTGCLFHNPPRIPPQIKV